MKLKCPSCGFENIEGEDRCEQCLHSLMQRDLPKAKKDDALQTVMMTAPISDLLTGKDLLVASTSDSVQKIIRIFVAVWSEKYQRVPGRLFGRQAYGIPASSMDLGDYPDILIFKILQRPIGRIEVDS